MLGWHLKLSKLVVIVFRVTFGGKLNSFNLYLEVSEYFVT